VRLTQIDTFKRWQRIFEKTRHQLVLACSENREILQQRDDADDDDDDPGDLLGTSIDGKHADQIQNKDNNEKRDQNADQDRQTHTQLLKALDCASGG
jgi:hypothetical protein